MGVVDMLIERVSGQFLEKYMQQAVFKSLAMTNTYTRFQPTKSDNFAHSYRSNLSLIARYDFLPYGGGGFFSSANDLIKYGMFFLKNKLPEQKQILNFEAIDLMHNFDKSPMDLMGLGWFNTGHSLVSNGRISGAQSNLTLVPSEKMAVVCLINASAQQNIADQIVDEIIDLLAPKLEKKLDAEKYAAIYETPYRLNPKLQGRWSGEIVTGDHQLPIQLFFKEDGKVTIKVDEADEQELQNVTFNQAGKLGSSFMSKIPVPEFDGDEDVYTHLALQLHEGKLIGHATPMFSNERGSFCYGAFLSLERE